jgi:hypothetical protein
MTVYVDQALEFGAVEIDRRAMARFMRLRRLRDAA